MAKKRPPDVVFKKAAHLVNKEGKSKDQAFAMAMSMYRSGRLTKEGKYIRKKK